MTRAVLGSAARSFRRTALAGLALIAAVGLSRAGDRCTDIAQAMGHDASAGVDDVESTIKTLIDHGAVLGLTDDRGKTARDIARGLGHERAAKLLER